MNKQQFSIYEMPALPTEPGAHHSATLPFQSVRDEQRADNLFSRTLPSVSILFLCTLVNPLQAKPHSIQLILLPSARLKVALHCPSNHHQTGIPSGFYYRTTTLTALLASFPLALAVGTKVPLRLTLRS